MANFTSDSFRERSTPNILDLAPLVEQLLLTPQIRIFSPVISKFYCQRYLKGENNEKEPGNGPFNKHSIQF